MPEEDKQEILHVLETPGRLVTPVKKFQLPEVRTAIKNVLKKSPNT